MNIENSNGANNRIGEIENAMRRRNNTNTNCRGETIPDMNGSQQQNRSANYNTNSGELLKKIQELCFVKTEAGLYLNAYPDCVAALDYFKKVCAELDKLVYEFESVYGPLTSGSVMGDEWSWTKGIWPWQLERTEEK